MDPDRREPRLPSHEEERAREWEAALEQGGGRSVVGERLDRQLRALGELAPAPAPAELEARVAAAADAPAREARALAALAALDGIAAPAALDGRVVAAVQAGCRQERAAAHVAGLPRRDVPAELDAAVEERVVLDASLPQVPAPFQLERELERDLADLPRTMSRRFAEKLGRQPAPADLEQAVGRRTDWRAGAPETRGAGTLRRGLMAAAAALVVGVGLAWEAGWLAAPGATPPAAPGERALAFEVLHADSPEELGPIARGLADGISGGLLEAVERAEVREDAAAARRAQSGGSNAGGSNPGAGARAGSSGAGGSGSTSAPNAPAGSGAAASTAATTAGAPGVPLARPTSLVDQLATAMETVSFRMVRRVTSTDASLSHAAQLEFREELITDGAGGFAVHMLEVLQPQMTSADEELFRLRSDQREGFTWRHRDFRIRQVPAFQSNYTVTDTGLQEAVAGRTCLVLEVRRSEAPERLHRLWVDPETAVVLRAEEELLATGQVTSGYVAESFDLSPDLSGAELVPAGSAWQQVDPYSDQLREQDPDLLLPVTLPDGYRLASAGRLSVIGEDWLRLVYVDGVEQVFFLQRQPEHELLGGNGGVHGGASSPTTGVGTLDVGDYVRLYHFGGWCIADGVVGGRELVVLGKLAEEDLLFLVQSALETAPE